MELVPDIDDKTLRVTAHASKAVAGASVKAVALVDGKEVAAADGVVGKAFNIEISDPKLWSPDSPFLYDLEVSLQSGGSSEGEKVQQEERQPHILRGCLRLEGFVVKLVLSKRNEYEHASPHS